MPVPIKYEDDFIWILNSGPVFFLWLAQRKVQPIDAGWGENNKTVFYLVFSLINLFNQYAAGLL